MDVEILIIKTYYSLLKSHLAVQIGTVSYTEYFWINLNWQIWSFEWFNKRYQYIKEQGLLFLKIGEGGAHVFYQGRTFEWGVEIFNAAYWQNTIYSVNREEIKMLKINIKLEKLRQNTQKLNVIWCSLSDEKLKLNDIHQEKHASIWLSTLPLKMKGFILVKVWLVILTTTHQMHLWSSKWCTTWCLAKKVVL